MRLRLFLWLVMLPLAACSSRGGDWPSLSPRPGEVSPMVPRNVAGQQRCPDAVDAGRDCARPAAPMAAPLLPPPVPTPTAESVEAELAVLEARVAAVEAAADPARKAVAAAEAAASGAAPESAQAAALAVAASRLASVLQPLQSAAFRLEALAASTGDAPDRQAYADRLASLAGRIAALDPQ
jgi:hypothetical protein